MLTVSSFFMLSGHKKKRTDKKMKWWTNVTKKEKNVTKKRKMLQKREKCYKKEKHVTQNQVDKE